VLHALLDIGLQIGRREVGASIRQLAWMTTLNPRTVELAIGRLVDKEWLSRRSRGRSGISSRYLLRRPSERVLGQYYIKHRSVGGRVDDVVLAGQVLRRTQHDAFRRYPATWRCYGYLDLVEPRTPAMLAEAIGCDPSTIRNHLGRLRDWGLAVRTADGWLRLDRQLDEVAEMRGTAGMVDDQRRRYAAESEAFQRRSGSMERIVDPETGEVRLVFTLGSVDP
jgi:DNA-binding IclR family transcriptional regulator